MFGDVEVLVNKPLPSLAQPFVSLYVLDVKKCKSVDLRRHNIRKLFRISNLFFHVHIYIHEYEKNNDGDSMIWILAKFTSCQPGETMSLSGGNSEKCQSFNPFAAVYFVILGQCSSRSVPAFAQTRLVGSSFVHL